MNTNISNLEALRDYLDTLIDEADECIEQLDQKIIENEQLIRDCINARKVLNLIEDKEDVES